MALRASQHGTAVADGLAGHGGAGSGLGGSLAFLGIGYVLILAAPWLTSHLQAVLSPGPVQGGGMVPAAAAAGLALLGAAAMVLVLSRLVRDVESRPYASIAPVLTVFTGFILMGLRARLPFEGLASQHLGVLALSLSLCGGALVSRPGWFVQAMGWLITVLPPVALAYAIAAMSGSEHDVFGALRRADSQVRVYVVLMGMSAVALGLVATASRLLAHAGAGKAGAGKQEEYVPLVAPAAQALSLPRFPHHPSGQAQESHAYGHGISVSVPGYSAYPAPLTGAPLLGLEDDEPLAKPRSVGPLAAGAVALVGLAAFAAYELVIVPRREESEAASRAAAAAPSASARASAEAERARESAAARAQLEALVAGSEARAAQPVAQAVEGEGASGPVDPESPTADAPAPAASAPRENGASEAAAVVPALVISPREPVAPTAEGAADAASAQRERARPVKATKKSAAARERSAARRAAETDEPVKAARAAREASGKAARDGQTPALAAAEEPLPKPASVDKPAADTSATKPSQAARPAKPVATGSEDLDLDQLVDKAMKHKGPSSVSASDDPLLGL